MAGTLFTGRRSNCRYRAQSSNPAFFASDLVAPNTILAIRAQKAALKHIGHGSQLLYRMQPSRRYVPNRFAAWRMAITSAWAVGSPACTTMFQPRPTTSPSFVTTAPKGPQRPDLMCERPNSTATASQCSSTDLCSCAAILFGAAYLAAPPSESELVDLQAATLDGSGSFGPDSLVLARV